MKNIKILTLILAIIMLNISCDNDGGTSVVPLDNGALPNFALTDGSDDFIKIGGFDNLSLEFSVGEGEGDLASYDLKALWFTVSGDMYGPVTLDANVTSFPKDYVITSADIYSAFTEINSVNDVEVGDKIKFYASLKLTDGTELDTFLDDGSANYYAPDFDTYPDLTVFLEYPVICPPQPGEYRIVMHDSYGDGWQTDGGLGGHGITVDVDGEIQEVGMCTPYEASPYDCTPTTDGFEADEDAIVTIPDGALKATWTFPGDAYGEISFEIYGPGNELLLERPTAVAGASVLAVTLCAQ